MAKEYPMDEQMRTNRNSLSPCSPSPAAVNTDGQDPYEGWGAAFYGTAAESNTANQAGEKAMPNSAPNFFVTDKYKPGNPDVGAPGAK